ncbi:MAG TPA: TolC family protein [Verrucomicrobiales bacterium]|nr:TolC family protein [Verrucomicrobiales bacterium]
MFRCVFLTILAATMARSRAESFTVEGAAARAVKSNPDLAAARWTIEEARGRLWHSGRPANPELETELKPNVRGREFSLSVGFTQKFPLTKRLFIERSISEVEFAVAEAEVRDAARLLKSQVRTAAVKLLALQSQKALYDEQRKHSSNLADTATKIAEQGEGSPLDAAQYELQVQDLTLKAIETETERATLLGELRPLLGLAGTASLTITGGLSAPSSPSAGASPERRADYQAALGKEAAARSAIELARAGKWDDAGFGLAAEIERAEDAPEGLRTEGFIGLKFSLPFPFWNKNEGKIHEAAATAAKAAKQREALAARIRAEAAAALSEMEAAAKIVAQTSGPLMKKAKELEEKYDAANKLGQAPIIDVLRSRERRFALEAARLNALRDYHLARVRLLAAQGQ